MSNVCNCMVVQTSMWLPFFGNGMSWLFPVLWPLLSFPNFLTYCVQHFNSIILKNTNSAGISSPPLALFLVMLPKVCLISDSRMSSSRWVTTPSWLSGSWRSFLYSFSVYSCQLFLISSVFVRSIQFLSYMVPIFGWNVPFVSLIFLKRSLVFSFLLFFYISLHWSLMKGFLSLLAILWNSTFKWFYLPWEIQLSYFTS